MNFSAHWHLVHANYKKKRKAAWPLRHQWYSIHLLLGAPCGNDRRAAVPPDRSHDATSPIRSVVCVGESVYILERMGISLTGERPPS
jgi:hypothetical protein